ncbi:hypothetical protein XENOCAPTIV_008585, partial [Xenoophorus captivus]
MTGGHSLSGKLRGSADRVQMRRMKLQKTDDPGAHSDPRDMKLCGVKSLLQCWFWTWASAAGWNFTETRRKSSQTEGNAAGHMTQYLSSQPVLSLFSRKPKESKAVSHNATGWRLFGKTENREEDPRGELAATMSPQQLREAVGFQLLFVYRPQPEEEAKDLCANLPAKSMEETQRHKLEYEEMVAGAKRRGEHTSQFLMFNLVCVCVSRKGTRRVRELWWQGLPPGVRGRVWSLAIGNELNITPAAPTGPVEERLDVLSNFLLSVQGGPYHDLLHSVLGAYTCYRPDIGYGSVALSSPSVFQMLKYFTSFEIFFEENLPRLFGHFQTNSLTPDLYLID